MIPGVESIIYTCVVFVCIVTDEKARNGEGAFPWGKGPREKTHYTEYSVRLQLDFHNNDCFELDILPGMK